MKPRVGISLAVIALIFLLALLLPMRISYGAGSLRCGTPLSPASGEEFGRNDCDRVAGMRIVDAIGGSWLVIGLTVAAVAARKATSRSGGRPPRSIDLLYGVGSVIAVAGSIAVMVRAYSVG